jgi:hypothetical protein
MTETPTERFSDSPVPSDLMTETPTKRFSDSDGITRQGKRSAVLHEGKEKAIRKASPSSL